MYTESPARYKEGKHCPTPSRLMAFIAGDDDHALDDHFDDCDYCAYQLEIATRAELRSILGVALEREPEVEVGSFPRPRRPLGWMAATAASLALAASLLLAVLLRPEPAAPGGPAVSFVGHPIQIADQPDHLVLQIRLDSNVIRSASIDWGLEGAQPVPIDLKASSGDIRLPSPRVPLVHADFRTIRPALKLDPYDGKEQLVSVREYRRDFQVTPMGIKLVDAVDDLLDDINRLGLGRPIWLADPQAFRVADGNRLGVELEVDPAYIQQVQVDWGLGDEQPATIYQGGDEPFVTGPRIRLDEQSPELPLRAGYRRLTPSLKIIPFDAVQEKLSSFFTPQRTEFRREFLIAPFGLVSDPAQLPAALIESVVYGDDEQEPDLYVVTGKAYPRSGAVPQAYLIIEPTTSSLVHVGAEVSLSETGDFACRCYLGSARRADNQIYIVYVVVADRPDASRLEANMEFAKDHDWEKMGYIKSPIRMVRDDGRGGFWSPQQ